MNIIGLSLSYSVVYTKHRYWNGAFVLRINDELKYGRFEVTIVNIPLLINFTKAASFYCYFKAAELDVI
jgi:hypothetical protein